MNIEPACGQDLQNLVPLTAPVSVRVSAEIRVPIASPKDLVHARQVGRKLAARIGFGPVQATLIATAISEVARNILDHAKSGQIILQEAVQAAKKGMVIVARDEGPGIANVPRALQYRGSRRKRATVGLPGAKWLMDELDIVSVTGKGTIVTMRKWLRPPRPEGLPAKPPPPEAIHPALAIRRSPARRTVSR